jgi:enoyl-CoA hydratase/carnithine racemase
MSEGRVLYERSGRVARLTFDNQKAYNALTLSMWHELADICTKVGRDRDIRVVTFRGAGGKSFISGTDIGGFLKFESGEDGVRYEAEMDRCIGAVEEVPQPTVAIVDGWAVGGGIAVAFSCDFRIATPAAKFGSPLGKTIGNCLSMRGYTRLVANVGLVQAKRILFAGEMLGAAEAKALGAIYDVVEADAIDAAAETLCQTLADMAPLTISASKAAMRRLVYGHQPNIDDLVAEVYASDDFKMGVRNFLDKKPRDWQGK